MNFRIKNAKLVFSILFIILIILIFLVYHFIIYDIFASKKFADELSNITIENENPTFKVHKVLMYSSGIPIENEESLSYLNDISITQYSDIAIYINNTISAYDITDENTVKELYINNINITTDIENNDGNTSNTYLNYKNPLEFGKFVTLDSLLSIDDKYTADDKIVFDIIYNNQQDTENNYNNPSFYADCSNPITLSYINDSILTNYSITDEQNLISFNGKVLGETGINLSDISYTLSFSINIVNNLDEKFICNFKLSIDLTSQNSKISNEGYLYTTNTFDEDEFQFFELSTN